MKRNGTSHKQTVISHDLKVITGIMFFAGLARGEMPKQNPQAPNEGRGGRTESIDWSGWGWILETFESQAVGGEFSGWMANNFSGCRDRTETLELGFKNNTERPEPKSKSGVWADFYIATGTSLQPTCCTSNVQYGQYMS